MYKNKEKHACQTVTNGRRKGKSQEVVFYRCPFARSRNKKVRVKEAAAGMGGDL